MQMNAAMASETIERRDVIAIDFYLQVFDQLFSSFLFDSDVSRGWGEAGGGDEHCFMYQTFGVCDEPDLCQEPRIQ